MTILRKKLIKKFVLIYSVTAYRLARTRNSNCLFFRVLFFFPVVICRLLIKTPFSHIVDRSRMESQGFSTIRGCLAAGQEELILLQEKVKNGKLSVDEALEKFKHWQMGKTGLEISQQVIQTPIPSGAFPQVQSSSIFVSLFLLTRNTGNCSFVFN